MIMNIEEFRDYCLRKPATSEAMPFNDNILVFRVFDKMFALTDVETFESINLKCNPDRAIELRELYSGITSGYHMNKKHWNTVLTDGSVPHTLLQHLIDHSYELVLAGIPQKLRVR